MKPAIVFLHGIGGAASAYAPQVDYFSRTHRALAWNAPGYGGRPLGDFTFEGLARRLIEDLAAFDIHRFALVGHSFGGMIAQQVARDFPQCLTHLVLAGTSPAFGNPAGEFQKQFIADRLRPLDEGRSMADTAQDAIGEMMADGADATGIGLAREAFAATPAETWRAAVTLLTTFDLRADLASIDVPAMLIVGEHDRNAPAGMMRKMASKIPHAQFIQLDGAGHLIAQECPVRFNAAVEGFLQGEQR